MKMDTRKLTVLAMISAMAFLLAAFVRIPVVPAPPLRYDPKDIVIVIAGFIYGPMAAFIVTVVVSFIQMFTVSATGVYGLFMNIVASTAFCCTAALIYAKQRTMKGALLGLVIAAIFATAVMMMWNYIVVPIYLGIPREAVVPMLIPTFLPFNLVSNTLNAALAILFYKRVKVVLQSMRLMFPDDDTSQKGFSLGLFIAILFIILTCVLWILILRGVIWAR